MKTPFNHRQFLKHFAAGCLILFGGPAAAQAQGIAPVPATLLPAPAANSSQQISGVPAGAPLPTPAGLPSAPIAQTSAATRLPVTPAAPVGGYLDAAVSAVGFAQPTPAPPAPPADTADDDLDELRERLENAETELLKMRSESKSAADKLVELLKGKNEGPKFPLIRLSGFMQVDDGLFSQDAENRAIYGDIQNGVGFRRTRLQALGNLTEMTRYSIEMDFAVLGRPSFMDVWGEQAELPFFGTIRIGQFRQPTTMDGMTSIRHLDFLERNAAFQALDPFRRVGVMAYRVADDEMSTLAYSVYATGFTFWNGASTTYGSIGDTRFGTQIGDSGGVSFAIRGTHLLYYDEPSEGRYLLHIGGGYNYSQIGGEGTTGTNAKTFEARAIPEFFVGDPTGGFTTAAGTPVVVDSGRVLANDFHFFHTELAGNYGSAHFQTEFLGTILNQMGGPPMFYYGAYLQGGYFLTGESEGYNKQTGVADYNTKPYSEFFGTGKRGKMCGWGAWEVAFRWTYLNISDTPEAGNLLPGIAGPPPVPNAGVLNESTLALNWYWNQYTRVQFNWIHPMIQTNNFGYTQFDIFGTRFQIEF